MYHAVINLGQSIKNPYNLPFKNSITCSLDHERLAIIHNFY